VATISPCITGAPLEGETTEARRKPYLYQTQVQVYKRDKKSGDKVYVDDDRRTAIIECRQLMKLPPLVNSDVVICKIQFIRAAFTLEF